MTTEQTSSSPSMHTRPVSIQDIPLDCISPNPWQARRSFDDLEELADSIREHGILSRIRVRPHPSKKDSFQIVYGERRLRAAKHVGLATISCEVAVYTDQEMIKIGLIENMQRQDLTPLEEASKFHELLHLDGKPYSIRVLAKQLGKHKSYIEDRLALLDLPEDVKDVLEACPKVALRALIEVAKLPTPEDRKPVLMLLQAGQSTEDVRSLVREVLDALKKKTSSSIAEEGELTDALIFQQALNRTIRRTEAALGHLEEVIHVYQITPDPKKREQLLRCIQEFIERAQQVKHILG